MKNGAQRVRTEFYTFQEELATSIFTQREYPIVSLSQNTDN